jgi:hypothetical protein
MKRDNYEVWCDETRLTMWIQVFAKGCEYCPHKIPRLDAKIIKTNITNCTMWAGRPAEVYRVHAPESKCPMPKSDKDPAQLNCFVESDFLVWTLLRSDLDRWEAKIPISFIWEEMRVYLISWLKVIEGYQVGAIGCQWQRKNFVEAMKHQNCSHV